MSSTPLVLSRRRSPRLACGVSLTAIASPTSIVSTSTISTALAATNNDDDGTDNNQPPTKRIKIREEDNKNVEQAPAIVTKQPITAVASSVVSPSPSNQKRTKSQSSPTATNATRKGGVKKSPAKTQTTAADAATTTPEKKQTAAKKKTKPSPAALPKTTPPVGWEGIYSLVEELRQDKTAPVDHAGAEALPETCHGPVVYRFQVLIALMLSSQTKDAVVEESMRKLQQHGLTIDNIAHRTTDQELNALIQKVGFHNNKTKYIKQTVQILLDKYNGDIPKTAQEMIDNLPGVGPKMAYLVETIAWGTTSGIGIDTHMHRMYNQLGWVNKTKNPEQTRMQLEAWLPREKWPSVNYVWVGFGQEVQQFKPKLLRKALECSRPVEALKLLKKLGLDPVKEGDKIGLGDHVREVMKRK